MTERPLPPPEGQLITSALDKLRPKLPLREAARRAEVSESRWRQIVSGYQMVNGTPVAVTAPADTIARMARAVGVQSFQLRDAGRADAANELQDIEINEKHGHKTKAQVIAESEEIAAEIRELLKRRGLDRNSQQMRVADKFIAALAETIAEFDADSAAS